jgi:hypothetical protein
MPKSPAHTDQGVSSAQKEVPLQPLADLPTKHPLEVSPQHTREHPGFAGTGGKGWVWGSGKGRPVSPQGLQSILPPSPTHSQG